jgi:Peptidase A4 family
MDTTYESPRTRPSLRLLSVAAGIALLLTVGGIKAVSAQSHDPQTAAIEQVIQLANDEQGQAIASNDPSVMQDTATPEHYQQLIQINQDLVSQGVTSIQLANLSWGPVSVSGTTATATTSETWRTTFSDGSTMQSTDTNNYSLVDQNGSWLISDDQQPTSGSQPSTQPGAARPGASQPASPLSQAPTSQATSRNWSGYAATNGSYTGVSATWTVPQPATTGAPGVGATWVGIGGVNSTDLIQAGTQDVANGGGQSEYQAWIETLPQASRQVPLAVSPGDSVTVSINEQGAGTGLWQIAIKNNTSGKSYQTNVRYNSSESSAEWVEEAPVGNGSLLPLDDFSSVNFTQATAVQNGQTVNLTQSGARPITMLNGVGEALAVPSAIGSDGTSFDVSRTSASATPIPSTTNRRTPRGISPFIPIPFGY